MRARPKWGPSHQEAFRGKKKPVHQSEPVLCWHYLSSRAVARKVLSAQMSLTSVFGMGTGGQLVRKGYPFFMLKARGPQRWSILTRLPAFVKPFFSFFLPSVPFARHCAEGRDRWSRPFPGIARQCAYRRGNPYSLGQGVAERNFSRRIQKALWFSPGKA